jgi:hypothetical protein
VSLARACLRLAAVAALRGRTIAGTDVADSRIGAIEALAPEKATPIVAVYTEDDAGDALSANNGGPPFVPQVQLVFEMSIVEAQYDADGAITDITCPTTDAELEASLDTLEAQIQLALFQDLVTPLSLLFQKAYRRVMHRQSLRFPQGEKAERFATRYLIYKVEVFDDLAWTSFDPTLSGLDRLPKTFRDIAVAWPDALPEKAVALAIAGALVQPSAPPLLGLDARMAAGRSANGRPTTVSARWLTQPKER